MKIEFPNNWRPAANRLIHAGIYRVPQDLPAPLADRALRDKVALVVAGATPVPLAEPDPLKRPRRKTAAPENKIVSIPSEAEVAVETETATPSSPPPDLL